MDGQVDADDIDLLYEAINAGEGDAALNLDGLGGIDQADVDFLVREILQTQYGDANLDGRVDALDWVLWNNHRFQTGTGWASADFDGSGATDGSDFNVWNLYKFTAQPAAKTQALRPPRAPVAGLARRAVEPISNSNEDVDTGETDITSKSADTEELSAGESESTRKPTWRSNRMRRHR